MLVCKECGSLMISDGTTWTCGSFVANPEVHTLLNHKPEFHRHARQNPPTLADKRIGVQ